MRDGNNEGRAAVVLNRQRAVKLEVPPLRAFAERVRKELALPESLTICFVTDAEIARMNEAFRKKPGPTDVLSFPAHAQRGKPRKLQTRSRSAQVKAAGGRAIATTRRPARIDSANRLEAMQTHPRAAEIARQG